MQKYTCQTFVLRYLNLNANYLIRIKDCANKIIFNMIFLQHPEDFSYTKLKSTQSDLATHGLSCITILFFEQKQTIF